MFKTIKSKPSLVQIDNWSRQQTLLLIKLLRNYPCLYSSSNPHYTNKAKRHEKLNLMFIELLKHKKDVTLQSIKNKIRTLQSQLSREKSKITISRKSGASAEEEYIPKLWCYNELLFLQNCNDNKTNEDESMPSSVDLEYITLNESNNYFKDEAPERSNTILSEKGESPTFDMHEFTRKSETNPTVKDSKELSKEEVFCQYLCSELKNIQLDETFDDVKIEILQLVIKKIKSEKLMLRQENYFVPVKAVQSLDEELKHRHISNTSTPLTNVSQPRSLKRCLPIQIDKNKQNKSLKRSTPGEDLYQFETVSPTSTLTPPVIVSNQPHEIQQEEIVFEPSTTTRVSPQTNQFKVTQFGRYLSNDKKIYFIQNKSLREENDKQPPSKNIFLSAIKSTFNDH